MFYIPIKLKPELARASMTLARFIQNVLRSTLLHANKTTKKCIQFLNRYCNTTVFRSNDTFCRILLIADNNTAKKKKERKELTPTKKPTIESLIKNMVQKNTIFEMEGPVSLVIGMRVAKY